MAANLLDELESDVAGKTTLGEDVKQEVGRGPAGENRLPEDITFYVLATILAFVLLEVLYIKYRGDA